MSRRTGHKPSDARTGDARTGDTRTGEPTSLDRRRLFMLGGTVAAAAAVPLAGQAQAAESDADRKKARYRETDHVKTFYRVNRY